MSMHTLQRRALLATGLVGLAALVQIAGCSKSRVRAQAVPVGATVLALGDSLTHGTGADANAAFPSVLARLTGWQVVNAGVPGDTAAQALERLPALLAEHSPRLVLVGVGGNDFLRRLPEADTRANLMRICRDALASGAQVLLIAVPRPSAAAAFTGSLSDHALYAQIAEELKLPLQRQGWSAVLADERLRSDAIHANAAGYEQFAKALAATARAVGLLVP